MNEQDSYDELMEALRFTVRVLLIATRIDPEEQITSEMVDAHVDAVLGLS